MSKDSKIFVAGGTGMVGSAIIRKLLSSGYNNLVSNTHSHIPASTHPQIHFVRLNLTRQEETDAFFEKQKPDYVFLAAARVGGILANSTYKADFIYDNIMIGANVIHASYKYGVKKLMNLGSSCIYPKNAPQPLKEEYLLTDTLEPTNEPYALAKIAAIKLCRYYNEQYGTNFISVMPTNLYGPNDNFDLETSHVLPALLRKFHLAKLLTEERFDDIKLDLLRYGNATLRSQNSKLKITMSSFPEEVKVLLDHYGIHQPNKPDKPKKLHTIRSTVVTLWGSGTPFREFLYVDDLADACLFLMENYDNKDIGEFVNIGIGEDIKVRELAYIIKIAVGYEGEIKWDKTKPDGTPRKLLDVSMMTNFGWKSKVPLDHGISKTYQWYCSALSPRS